MTSGDLGSLALGTATAVTSRVCSIDALVALLVQDLSSSASKVVAISDDGVRRRVSVLDWYEVVFDRSTCEVSLAALNGTPEFIALVAADLGAPLTGSGWLDAYVLDRIATVDGVAEVIVNDAALHTLVRTVRRRLVARHALRALRAAIRAAYALAPEVVHLCYQTRDHAQGGFSIGHYARVWAKLASYARVARETPSLLRLLAAADEAQVPFDAMNPVPDLRRLLLACGWSPALWRVLAKGSPRFFLPVLRHRDASAAWDAIVSYGAVLSSAKVRREPPTKLITALLLAMFNPEAGEEPFARRWCMVPPDVLAIALREAESRREHIAAFLQNEFMPVVQWACTRRRPLDANQRRAGWAWLLARAHRWQASELRRLESVWPWVSLVSRTEHESMVLVPLQSALQLAEEGFAMRHCIGRYAQECKAGQLRVFSAIDAASGKRIATIALQWAALGWRVCGVRGFANAAPGERTLLVAEWLAQRYTDAALLAGHMETNGEREIM